MLGGRTEATGPQVGETVHAMTTRRKRPVTPAAPSATDSVLREILESEAYREKLRERLLDGSATTAELGLARELGMRVSPVIKDREDAERRAMEIMPRERRRLMTDTIREYEALVRQVLAGTEPDTRVSDLPDDLLPPR